MLLLAVLSWPYAYYQLLRLVVCGVTAWGAANAARLDKASWQVVLAGLALLFNPILPVNLSRDAWVLIDVATAAILIASLSRLAPHRVFPVSDPNLPWWEDREAINREGPSDRALAVGDREKYRAYLRRLGIESPRNDPSSGGCTAAR